MRNPLTPEVRSQSNLYSENWGCLTGDEFQYLLKIRLTSQTYTKLIGFLQMPPKELLAGFLSLLQSTYANQCEGKKGLFWLMVPEVSVPGPLAVGLWPWIPHYRNVWQERAVHPMAMSSKEIQEADAPSNLTSFHSALLSKDPTISQ